MPMSYQAFIDFYHAQEEYWKPVIYDYVKRDTYLISSFGNIKYINSNDIINKNDVKGYQIVTIRDINDNFRNIGIHRLVANAFCQGRSKERNFVNHIDGCKNNNKFTNLEWCTVAENNIHAYQNDLLRIPLNKAEREARKEDVKRIRDSFIKHKGSQIKVYNELIEDIPWITHFALDKIKYAKSWTSVTGFTKDTFKSSIISDECVHKVCETLLNTDGKIKETLELLKPRFPDLTRPMIDNIKRCHTHTEISSKYFDKDTFEKPFRLTNEEVKMIKQLSEQITGYGSATTILSKLKPRIPNLTIKQVRDIQNGLTHNYA